jgi:hypothetical protein
MIQPIASITAQQFAPLLQATTNTLPITINSWVPIAIIAALTVALIAGLVYALAGIINSDEARGWARFQLYEVMLSVILIVVFASITYLFFLNPQTLFGKLNLVPTGCTSATTMYTLSACDLSLFNNASFAFGAYTFYATFTYTLLAGILPQGTWAPLGSTSIEIQLTPPGLGPTNLGSLLTWAYGALLLALIFNQVQLMLLSASLLLLAFFLTIGLIARTLGFLRTFGGAMIAFGLGIGIIYPILISLTYGYVDVTANLACLQYYSTVSTVLSGTTFQCGFSGFIANIFAIYAASAVNPSILATSAAGIPAALGSLVSYIGYIIAGLTIIPLMNIVILDAFVIDFSSAIGERMSITQLFANFL